MSSQKNQKAGALISQGAYGCVYTPPLPCVNASPKAMKSKTKMVTKVFGNNDDMETEWDISEKIKKIDPDQKYFIYATAKCNVRAKEVERQSKLSGDSQGECEAVQEYNYKSSFPSLSMRFGGSPFHNWIVSHRGKINVVDLVRILMPCFQALRVLVRNNLVHQDVKANNILIDDKLVTRFIDFTFTVPATELLDPNVNPKYMKSYWVFGPEYRIRKFMSKGLPINENEIRRLIDTEDTLISHTFKSADYDKIKNIKKYFWTANESEIYMRSALKRAIRAKTNTKSVWARYNSRVDVYSFGLVLLWASQHTSTFLERPSALMAMGPEIEKKAPAWVAFRDLVRHMTCPDPKSRATIMQALRMAKSIANM